MRENEILSGMEAADEMLLMGLRLREGIDPARHQQMAGSPLNPKKIEELGKLGFLQVSEKGRLRATQSGAMVLDAVVADLAS